MVASMTAFGRAEQAGDWGNAVWEIRSVNHRYLDVTVRLPEEFRVLEGGVRERITARIQRGKVECQLRNDRDARAGETLSVNARLAAALVEAAESLPVRGPSAINPVDILRWPGVLERPSQDQEAVSRALLETLDRALDSLVETRRREGAAIGRVVEERCAAIETRVLGIRESLPGITAALRDRVRQRAAELKIELDPSRLEQEILLLTQKMDVAEELDRIDAHIAEVRRALGQSGPVGRRLDFLMQELNREANTLGSKAASIDLSNASVDVKVLIEQIREQIQNVE